MFFGGMFLGYTDLPFQRIRKRFADASNHLDIWLGTINTAVLIVQQLSPWRWQCAARSSVRVNRWCVF